MKIIPIAITIIACLFHKTIKPIKKATQFLDLGKNIKKKNRILFIVKVLRITMLKF
jgi:hypothetical protein